MAKPVIILDDYKKDKHPFKVMPADNVASEDLPIQIKEVEKVVPNNIKHVKNTFDEVVGQFTKALQSPIRFTSEGFSNITPTDKADKIKPIDVEDNYFDATQDINKDQREKSNVSLVVAPNADDEVVLCSGDGNINNKQDENRKTYCGIDLPSHENMDVLSENDAMLTNVSDSSDEESTPKKSKQFTFTDSDLPDSDEIRDILMSYPKPTVVESFSESESESSSEDERVKFLRRCRNKTEPDTMIGIENLPSRVMTRLRNSARMFKPSYLKKQEAQIDEDIILENIKRIKSFKKANTYKDSKNHESIKQEKKETTPRKKTDNKSNEHKKKVKVKIEKPAIKRKKTKSSTRKNTKEDSLKLNSISAANTTTRMNRSMKKENDGKNTQNKCINPGKKNKKPDHKQIPYKKERTIFPEIGGRRSKRQQKAKEKNDVTMKAPITILKKSIPKQRTVNNISSSNSESPKSLKRSLVAVSDVPSSKRTRSHNNNSMNIVAGDPATIVKTQYVHMSAFPGKELKQDKLDPYVQLLRYEPAQKRIRTLSRTREAARTSTKRL